MPDTGALANMAESLAAGDAAASAELGPVDIMDEGGHLRSLEDIERDLIEFAIETYAGRMAEVARRLGIMNENDSPRPKGPVLVK